jgi:hypothetical protein
VLKRPTAWLLSLYPPLWRERYGDEVAALLDELPVSPGMLWDVLRGALDARRLILGRRIRMANQVRQAEILVFCAYIAFVVSGLGFAKMTEYDDFADATRAFPVIGLAFDTIVVGAYIALLAVLVGGLPLAAVAAWRALVARRWAILALFAVPPLAFAFYVGYILLLVQVIAPAIAAGSDSTPKNVALALSLAVVTLLAAIGSTAAVSSAIARGAIPPRLLAFARLPALVATLAMLVVTLALIVWGLALRGDVPDLFNGGDGILATNTALNWLVHVVVMGVATSIAAFASLRAFAVRMAPQCA